jgi:hypothetical protein
MGPPFEHLKNGKIELEKGENLEGFKN